ncbi:hypothetical protein Tco_0783481 [Tanacetum coccineum]
MDAFKALKRQFQLLITFQYIFDYLDDLMICKFFLAYTRTEVQQFRYTLIQHMASVKKFIVERAKHKRESDNRMNDKRMQSKEKQKLQTQEVQSNIIHELKVDSVVMENTCSGKENGTSETASSKTVKESIFDSATKEVHAIIHKMSKAKEICMTHEGYITHDVDANIRPVNDQVLFAEVQLTAQHNVLANVQQHTNQSKPSYDTYLLEKVDSNTTPDSTNMCHRGGEIDQDAEQYQAKSPLLKAELVKSKEMIEKETYNELSRRFLLLEKHCISLEISIQHKEESFQSNKPCKNQDAPEFREFFEINDLKAQLQAKTTLICNLKNQIKSVKDASNEAKVKNDIDVIETINIELEHSVAKLLAANEQLHKENEHLKQTYKELYDSIKKTRVQNKDNSDSLISQINQKSVENADLKAQIQEKVFANAALKNELRKLKGNSVDTKNSQKVSYGSNDIAHNHYLEEARKKAQERNRNSKPSVMHTTSLQNTTNGSKPNPRSNNQISKNSKHFFCSTCHKCVFNANHDACITKFLKEVNSRAKVQSPKTKTINKSVEPKSHTQKPGRQIAIGQMFSPKKSSVMFTDNTTRVDSGPSNGSNDDITNSYECDQTLNVSEGTTNLSAEYVLAKPHHVIAPGSSRNSQEESYGSNDMAHNHYLEEARKKTQERNRNSKPSVMPSVRLQNTANDSTPDPKRTNQTSRSLPISKSSCVTITVVPKADHSRNSSSFSDSKHFFCSTCHKCIFNANHDACITKLLNEVNSLQASDLNVIKMASADSTSGPALQRKERCTFQCALSLEEEKSSCLRPFLSTSFMLFHARSVIKWINKWSYGSYATQYRTRSYFSDDWTNKPVSPALAVSVPVNSAGTPSSTTIDQDAPSPSHSPSSSALQSLSLHKGVAADSTLMEDNPFAPVDNHPFINVFAPEPSSEASSSGDLSSAESPYVSQTLHHLGK